MSFESLGSSEIEEHASPFESREGVNRGKSPEKTDQERFKIIRDYLEAAGAKIEYIPLDSSEDAQYIPSTDTVRFREGKFQEALEEAFHRKQTKLMERLGFREFDPLDPILRSAGEVAVTSLVVRFYRTEMRKIKQRLIRKMVERGETGFELRDNELREAEMNLQDERMRRDLYLYELHRDLEHKPESEREKYRKLFMHPLFADVIVVLEWIEEGYLSEDMWVSPEARRQREILD